MSGLMIETLAAVAVGLFVVFLVLQPLLMPEPQQAPDLSPLDDFVDPDETPEGAAVAALREIEFDRATGKLSDEDYAYLTTKYTAIAVQALRVADGAPAAVLSVAPIEARAALERLVAQRASQLRGASLPVCGSCGPRPESDADFCSGCGDALGTGRCRGCQAPQTPGGRFCDQCGTRYGAT